MIVAVTVLLSVLLLWRKKPQVTLAAYACVMLAVFTWDWFVLVPRLEGDYRADSALMKEIQSVNQTLADVPPEDTLLEATVGSSCSPLLVGAG